MSAKLENKDYSVSAWLDSEGNTPTPETKVSLQDLLDGRFTFIDQERRPLMLAELRKLDNCYGTLEEPYSGIALQKDPPTCVLCEKACHLGWSEAWSKDEKGDYALRYCKCPDCVIEELRQMYSRTGVITTTLCRRAYLETNLHDKGEIVDPIYAKIHSDMEYLQTLVTRFEEKIWKGGFGNYYLSRQARGVGADLASGAPFMVYCLAGRVMCQLGGEENEAFVNMLTLDTPIDPDLNQMGLQGICATVEEAEALFKEAFRAWDNEEIHPKDNPSIGLLGFMG